MTRADCPVPEVTHTLEAGAGLGQSKDTDQGQRDDQQLVMAAWQRDDKPLQ